MPEKTPYPTLPSFLRHIEHANIEADIVEDAGCVFLVELVDESSFWGQTELRGVYTDGILSFNMNMRWVESNRDRSGYFIIVGHANITPISIAG
jgi:hypothetical protein